MSLTTRKLRTASEFQAELKKLLDDQDANYEGWLKSRFDVPEKLAVPSVTGKSKKKHED
jgi:hypothetical protein